ncbi:MAG: hypothetical protein ACK578_11610 [Pirellula sp.]
MTQTFGLTVRVAVDRYPRCLPLVHTKVDLNPDCVCKGNGFGCIEANTIALERPVGATGLEGVQFMTKLNL